MAHCPECKKKIAAWRTWVQTNSTQLTCRECGTALRMNRAWWSVIGGGGAGVTFLTVKPLFHYSKGLGITALVVLVGVVLWLAATVVPVDRA